MDASITPIHTVVTGVAMSAGFMIAIHGSKRYAYKHATFMYHQLSSVAWGTLADMKDSVEESERLHKKLIELVIKKTKIPLKTLEENYERKKDWFMPVEEALSLGVSMRLLLTILLLSSCEPVTVKAAL
jgi:ATP-dependent protease ClpP protease subunit